MYFKRPAKLTIIVDGQKMRMPLKPAQTVQALANELLERVERVNATLAASLRAGERRFVSFARESDNAVVAALPRDRDVVLQTLVADGDTLIVELSQLETLDDVMQFNCFVCDSGIYRLCVCVFVFVFCFFCFFFVRIHTLTRSR